MLLDLHSTLRVVFTIYAAFWVTVLIVLFIGLFIDEMPIAAFAIVPLVFWEHFLPSQISKPRLMPFVQNALFFVAPSLAFAAFVIFVAPIIIQHYLGFKFDYLGDTLATSNAAFPGASIIQGRVPLTFGIILENFTTLFGLSLAPWVISSLWSNCGCGAHGSHGLPGWKRMAI